MQEEVSKPELTKTTTDELKRLFLLCGIILLCVIVAVIAYSIGYAAGIAHMLGTCFQYPFLLIDSSKYLACPIN